MQLVDVRSYKLVSSRSFEKEGPLRLMYKLHVRAEQNYVIRRARDSDELELDDADDVKARMRFAVVDQLE